MKIITMIKLTGGMCRWPFGDPKDKDFHFCGHASDYTLSYCEEHMVMAHAPDNRRRKAIALKAA
jgi:GcrA cell cycle regulator